MSYTNPIEPYTTFSIDITTMDGNDDGTTKDIINSSSFDNGSEDIVDSGSSNGNNLPGL